MARRSRPNPASFLSSLAAEWAWLLPVRRAYLGAGSLAGALIALLILGAGAAASRATGSGVIAGAGATAPAIFTGRAWSLSAPWPAVLTLLTLGAFAAFGAATVWLTITDVRERRLPNVVVLGGTIALTVPLSIDVAAGGDVARLGYIWLAAAVFGLLMLGLWSGLPGHVGAGDVKLAPAAMFLPAWSVTAVVQADSASSGTAAATATATTSAIAMAAYVFAVCLCAALLVAAIMMLIRSSRELAFGPVMLAASWATVIVCPVLS